VRRGKIAAVEPSLTPGPRTIHEHVTGFFGLNPDMVGIRSGVTAVVDQGGASPLTFDGFRVFIVEPAVTRSVLLRVDL
jgi:dihydroorotase